MQDPLIMIGVPPVIALVSVVIGAACLAYAAGAQQRQVRRELAEQSDDVNDALGADTPQEPV